MTRWPEFWKVFKEKKLGVIGVIILICFIAVALFAPLIAPYNPSVRVSTPFLTPSSQHLLGTNDIGNDILSELIYGTRISLLIGVIAAFISISIGLLVGLVAGYYGGLTDALLMRIVDLILVIPFLPLMIVLSAYLGPSFWNIIIVIGILSWVRPARVIRSQVLTLKTKTFVESARSLGATNSRLLFTHIMPGVIPLALAQFVLASSYAILVEASLSFLGLGDPFQKSWGTILYYAQARGAFLTSAWVWWILPPGLLTTILVLGFTFTGYSLEEILNPRLRGR
ncbi:MAG: ABC transporter permease [Dethiobacter sp.]|jgi:ABC-type dipeptide/oligopeptide/nickel transport system permease subunit|nr:ABC transporter permease [Dethiobacter sp.]